jgi:RNA recognition motif-containing protein
MTKLFIGGFPLETNELQIVQLVSLHGDVETIKIVRDKQTKKCKGYAFLEMKDRAGADAAIEALDGAMMGDRVLSVGIAPDKAPALPPPSRRPTGGSYVKTPRPGGNYNQGTNQGQGQSRGYGQSSGEDQGQRPRRPRKF